MRLVSRALLAVAVVVFTGCGMGPVSVAQTVEPGRHITLKPGQSAALSAAADLRVGFDSVVADSRCPKGEQCVRAGEAIVKIWLQRGAQPRQVMELASPRGAVPRQGEGPLHEALGYQVIFVSLEPYPVGSRATPVADYALTVSVWPGPARESVQ